MRHRLERRQNDLAEQLVSGCILKLDEFTFMLILAPSLLNVRLQSRYTELITIETYILPD